jgi:PAS domain S-box-containing protein
MEILPFLSRYWNRILRTGYNPAMDQTQATRLFAINAFLLIALVITVIFILLFVSLGSYSALQGVVVIPFVLLVLYFNSRSWFATSRIMVTYGLMVVALALALTDRRTGTEYILIAIGCCSAMIYEKVANVVFTFLFAFACYLFYVCYDAYFPFKADPTIDYLLAQNFLMFVSGFVVMAQTLVFRFLVNDYAAKLKIAYTEIGCVNQKLKATNEELEEFSQNLDQLVRRKSAQLQAYNTAIDTNILLVTLDPKGTFLSANEPLLSVCGYSEQELIGQHYNLFDTGQFTNEQLVERYEWLSAGNTWTGELRYKSKSGAIFWIDAVVIPITEESGQVKEFLSMGILITERKELESKNLSAIQALE